jgi:propanediol utilization protein
MSQAAIESSLNRSQVEQIVRQFLRHDPRLESSNSSVSPSLVVNISARHVHVRQEDLETLFGEGYQLTKMRDLYQEGEFASNETVTLVGPRRRAISKVRILGPTRNYTQVELAFTDARSLGIDAPVRVSGNHEGTPGCYMVGPAGTLQLDSGVIRAARHVHMNPFELVQFGVQDGDLMKLRVETESGCSMTLDDVLVRQHPRVKLEIHLDTDEGNACDLPNAKNVTLIK